MLSFIGAPIDAKLPPMRHARMDRHVAFARDDADLETCFCAKSAVFRQALMLVALIAFALSNTPPQHSHARAPCHARP
jgi:hypothetical protein